MEHHLALLSSMFVFGVSLTCIFALVECFLTKRLRTMSPSFQRAPKWIGLESFGGDIGELIVRLVAISTFSMLAFGGGQLLGRAFPFRLAYALGAGVVVLAGFLSSKKLRLPDPAFITSSFELTVAAMFWLAFGGLT
ncbi:MAG: hypothetical protein HZB26_06505 [Candidatus Hydrogenedentes bacterium]|nr:hypothetical protein [Candidatus Hydrogenedentota bacterium]